MPHTLKKKLCGLCSQIVGRAKTFSSTTVSSHVNSMECESIRKNLSFFSDLKCKFCPFNIPQNKFSISRLIAHLTQDHNSVFSCVFCPEKISIPNMFNHIVCFHAKTEIKDIKCKRCKKTYDPNAFFLHLKTDHQISQPNFFTIKSYISENLEKRNLAVLAIILVKYEIF